MFTRSVVQSGLSFNPRFSVNGSDLLDRRFHGYRPEPLEFSPCSVGGIRNFFQVNGDGFRLTYAADERELTLRESRGENIYILWEGRIPVDSDPADFIQELLIVNRGYLGPGNVRHFISALCELRKELQLLDSRGRSAA